MNYEDGMVYERVEPQITARRLIPSRKAAVQQPSLQQIIPPAPQPPYAYPAYPVTYVPAPPGVTSA